MIKGFNVFIYDVFKPADDFMFKHNFDKLSIGPSWSTSSNKATLPNSNVELHQVASKVQIGNTLKIKLLELKPKKQENPQDIMFLCNGVSES